MDAFFQAVGMIEFTSIAAGVEGADRMVKAARTEILFLKTACPGKFLAAVHGDVAAVQAAVGAGLECGRGAAADHFVIPNISPAVIPALAGALPYRQPTALGIIETFTAACSILAADAAVKAADVDLIEVRIAMGLGGKAFSLLTGDVGSVEQAVAAGANQAARNGLLVRRTVIPRIAPEVVRHIA